MEDYKKEFEEEFIKPFNELIKKGEEIIAKYKSNEEFINMRNAFKSCYTLKKIPKLNTYSVTNMQFMIDGKMPKGKIWKPREGEKYWAVCVDGGIAEDVNNDTLADKGCILFGNAYPTKEKAEFEANREKYTRLFRQYVEQHSEPLDWEDDYQEKWYVYLSGDKKCICFDSSTLCQDAFQIYASSKEVLQEAIEFVGESNFKKYVLEEEDDR